MQSNTRKFLILYRENIYLSPMIPEKLLVLAALLHNLCFQITAISATEPFIASKAVV